MNTFVVFFHKGDSEEWWWHGRASLKPPSLSVIGGGGVVMLMRHQCPFVAVSRVSLHSWAVSRCVWALTRLSRAMWYKTERRRILVSYLHLSLSLSLCLRVPSSLAPSLLRIPWPESPSSWPNLSSQGWFICTPEEKKGTITDPVSGGEGEERERRGRESGRGGEVNLFLVRGELLRELDWYTWLCDEMDLSSPSYLLRRSRVF